MTQPLRKIMVVGGGTAGWMCAAALSAAVPKTCEIVLIESEDIGTIGVGEATVPQIRFFNDQIGLDEAEMIRACEATFKLGIDFRGWGHKENRYFHGFGDFGDHFEGVSGYQMWRRLRDLGEDTPLEAYSLPTQMAYAGRFFPPNPDPRSPMHDYRYAFHFDASLYAAHLRRHCEARGVKRINARINDVRLRPEDGFITGVVLDDGRLETADFFIDCSGFRGLLIEGALKTGYTDWSHWLPVDRAWAVPTERTGDILPYTISQAHESGWQWRIPLQHRTGNGYVYSSRFADDATALDILTRHLDAPTLKDPFQVRFTTGHRNRFWSKNCVCVGLASGFIEPLESTSINFIQNVIVRFLEFFPTLNHAPVVEDQFNSLILSEYERVRDFIILHYRLNSRSDGKLWRYCADMPIPDDLAARIELFRYGGRTLEHDRDSFKSPSWISIFHGQGLVPQTYDHLADRIDEARLKAEAARRRQTIADIVPRLPAHDQFIAAHCASPAFLKRQQTA